MREEKEDRMWLSKEDFERRQKMNDPTPMTND